MFYQKLMSFTNVSSSVKDVQDGQFELVEILHCLATSRANFVEIITPYLS